MSTLRKVALAGAGTLSVVVAGGIAIAAPLSAQDSVIYADRSDLG